MKTTVIRANSRGNINFGWLNAYHTFSFGEYSDRNRMGFGALRVVNDDFVKPQAGFPLHPHDNMEIITVVLKGTIEHQDSLNHHQQISAGEIQVMSAGSGIVHSEANPSATEELNLFQIWIHPKLRNISPRYEQKSFIDILEHKNRWHYLVTADGREQSLTINQDALIAMADFDQSAAARYDLTNSANGVFLMVVAGEITLADGTTLENRDAILISDVKQINFAVTKSAKLLLIEVPLVN